MFLVIGLNSDEFGRGSDRPVKKFEEEGDLRSYLLSCNEDINRLEVYRATKLTPKLTLEEEREMEDWGR